MPNRIWYPHQEGICSKQAHADFPEQTFEREAGRDGFYGPASHFHHRHAPTGWSDWQGELRPRAFDFTKIDILPKLPIEDLNNKGRSLEAGKICIVLLNPDNLVILDS